MQILIKPEQFEGSGDVQGQELNDADWTSTEVKPLESNLHVVDWVLQANQESTSMDELWEQGWSSNESNKDWRLESGLLLWKDQLFILDEDPELQTWLLDEVHSQVSTAHPGQTKTQQLVKERYYWPTWRTDVEQYV